MPALLLSRALLPDGWASHVLLQVDSDGTITELRKEARGAGAERVEGIVVPGVPNVHSHAFQRAMAGLAERGSRSGDSFWTWRERMYAFLARLEPDDVEAIAAQVYVEMLRHGYTSVGEFHYLRNDPKGRSYEDPVELGGRVLAGAERAGIGLTLLPALYRTGDFGGVPAAESQRRFTASVDEWLSDVAALTAARSSKDRHVGYALHSLRAVPPDDLRAALEAVEAGGQPARPVHIHVAEQVREVEACLAWSGARPVEWLLANAPVDGRWCLIHATHVTPDELEGLARSEAVIGLCPTTEANLGDGIFPLAEYAARRGRWAVGTDSHVSVSPVADLRLLEYGQRLLQRARNVAAGGEDRSTARALLEAAWAGGAQACGRPLGRLEADARADLVVLDPHHPALLGRADDHVLDSWIFSGEDTPVRHVMVGGRWVVRDGRHHEQEGVLDAYRAAVTRLAPLLP